MISGAQQLNRAKSALLESPIWAVRELAVHEDGDSLIISGRVSSFYHKQMAQEAILAVCRNVPLKNCVAVE